MPASHLFIVYLIQLLIVFLPSFGAAKMFEKAGVASWKAFIPFYNTWVMQELAQRPKHWVFWQFIPVVGWFITPGIFIEFVKLFGRFTLGEHTLATLFAPFYFSYLGYSDKIHYIDVEGAKRYKKPGWREWIDAAIFAIVAATLIRTFVFEAYTIPSGSMEKTLLVNDFLFVSKFSYGPRIPNTPLSIPFIHNYIPGTDRKSYSELIELPYIRWFASPVKRGDVVVFNFPAGDTVINLPNFQSYQPYYDVIRAFGNGDANKGRQYVLGNPDEYPILVHPPDKSDNYIKRCVGAPGETIEIRENIVYINGVMENVPPRSAIHYIVETNGQALDPDVMKSEYNIDAEKNEYASIGVNTFQMSLTWEAKNKMIKNGIIKNIKVDKSYNQGGGSVFPYDTLHHWTRDNFGPVWIPKKGSSVQLTPENISFYERVIRTYEHNTLEQKDGKFFINGKETNTYTFKMDYYWMAGDNRQDSQDSRYWGFVPEDRVVGKASIIWFSYEGGPRWSRLFRVVK